MKNCKNCITVVTGNYCSNCGKIVEVPRINGKWIIQEIGSVFNFEKGILLTIREVLLRPGTSIRKFLLEDRTTLVKPIIFLILCSLFYTFAQQLLHFEDAYLKTVWGDSAISKIFDWIQSNYGYANIFMGFFIAIWTKVFFRKSGFNLYEILILTLFTIGNLMIIYTFFGIAESISNLRLLLVGGAVGTIYSIWAIGQFFNKRKASSYIKAFFSNILGSISFFVIAAIIAILIDLYGSFI